MTAWILDEKRSQASDRKNKKGDKMVKKTIFALLIGMMALTLVPSEGRCWYSHHGYYHGYHHGYYYGDPLLWGLSGLVVGSAITAVALQPPPPPVVYAAPQTAVYTTQPNVPPGMCRWERYVLDGYGRTLMDRNGQPVKEYTVGSCQYPPN